MSEPTTEHINRVSLRAANLVYELAGEFPYRESYGPLERLAQRIQGDIVEAGCAAQEADRGRRERERAT